MKLYLMGDKYSIQNSHTGRSSLFLQNPLNSTKGRITTGVSTVMSLASETAHPNSSPKELPANEVRKKIKQKMKNCSAVLPSPTIQQMISCITRGIRIRKGISTTVRERQNIHVEYSLAPSSFKNTTLSLGNTIETGDSELMKPLMHMKNKKPTRVMKSTVLTLGLPFQEMQFLLILQYTPPTNRPRMMLWMNRALTTMGFRAVLRKSRFTMALRLWQKGTFSSRFSTGSFDLSWIWLVMRGFSCLSQVSKYLGQLLTLTEDSWWRMDMKQSGGLLNSGHTKPILSKYPTESELLPWQTSLPPTNKIKLSKRPKISELGWWIVMMTVLFSLRDSLWRQLQMMQAVRESRPEVGSSRMITDGLLTSSKAMEVLFRSPPETPLRRFPPTRVSMHFSSFRLLTRVMILCFLSSSETCNFSAATYYKVYLTVRLWRSTSSCMTQLAKSPKVWKLYGSWLAQILPEATPTFFLLGSEVKGILQAMILRSVVLPAPEAPMIAVTSPPLAIPEIPFRICFSQNFFLQGSLNSSRSTSICTEYQIFSKATSMGLRLGTATAVGCLVTMLILLCDKLLNQYVQSQPNF